MQEFVLYFAREFVWWFCTFYKVFHRKDYNNKFFFVFVISHEQSHCLYIGKEEKFYINKGAIDICLCPSFPLHVNSSKLVIFLCRMMVLNCSRLFLLMALLHWCKVKKKFIIDAVVFTQKLMKTITWNSFSEGLILFLRSQVKREGFEDWPFLEWVEEAIPAFFVYLIAVH